MKIKIIANPIANKGGSEKMLPLVEKELTRLGVNFDATVTRYPWHAADLAQQAVVTGYDVVVAAGGDGTVNEVINGLLLARDAGLGTARLGVLPIGRGNDFAFGMGLPTTWKPACKVLATGETHWIDVGRICGGLYPSGRYFGNGVGIGFDASVDFVAAEMKLTGFASYVTAALKTLAIDFHTPLMEIVLDDQTLTQPTLMVSIMNGRRMGGGFMMTPNSRGDDGLFDLCIAGKVNQAGALSIIPSFFTGTQHVHKKVIHFYRSQKVKITALDDTLPAHADGETICTQSKELIVELLPAQLELVVPKATPKRLQAPKLPLLARRERKTK